MSPRALSLKWSLWNRQKWISTTELNYLERTVECVFVVNNNHRCRQGRGKQNKSTFLMAAYLGSKTSLLFQLLPPLLLSLSWCEVLFCFYLERDKDTHSISLVNCEKAWHMTKDILYVIFVNIFDGSCHLWVLHGEQLLWPLAVSHFGFPQVLINFQLHQDLPDLPVPVSHPVYLLHLLPVYSGKFGVESCLDSVYHVLRMSWEEVGEKKILFMITLTTSM